MKREKKITLRWAWIIIIVLALGIIIRAMSYIVMSIRQFDQVFTKGVFIEEVHVGGLTKEKASSLIQNKLNTDLQKQLIQIQDDQNKCHISLQEFGVKYQLDEVLEEAFKVGHEENWLKKYQYAKEGIVAPQNFEVSYGVEISQIENLLKTYAEIFYVEPIDATIERKNKQFIITPEVLGKELDIRLLATQIKKAVDEQEFGTPIQVTKKTLSPVYTAETLSHIQTPISSFYTSYNNADQNRNINLQVASSKINEVLAPGETFLLSEHLEPISSAEGYRASKVIVNGRIEEGIGGGVCQIASTLYNAVLLSNLEIVTRQNHSLPVAYVPLGRDATYASDEIDFRFKNNSEYPVFIESYCENNRVHVNIFSHESLKPSYDEIKFQSETIEVVQSPAAHYIEDETITKGTEIQELPPLEGKKVKLYKLYYKSGELVKKEVVDTSYYKPRAAVIKVGTKEIVSTPPEETSDLNGTDGPLDLGGFLDLDILLPSQSNDL